MRAATLSLFALAGTSLAAPAYEYVKNVVVKTEVVTVVVTPGVPQPTPHHNGRPHHQSKPTTTPVYVAPKPSSEAPPPPPPSTPVYVPPKSTEAPPPPPPPSSTAAPPPPPPAETGYMAIVSEWRAKLGLPELTQDATLEANALKTCNDGNGQMKHELNPGTFAQVLAPGQPDEFEHVFVGGWLCEMPNMPGMDGVCASASEGWAYAGQTGHAEILSNKDYKKIGCACSKGIWGCDLA